MVMCNEQRPAGWGRANPFYYDGALRKEDVIKFILKVSCKNLGWWYKNNDSYGTCLVLIILV